MKVNLWLFVMYVGMAIFTFGHAANGAYENCIAKVERRGQRFDMCGADAVAYGLMFAVLWPLHWSWEAQS